MLVLPPVGAAVLAGLAGLAVTLRMFFMQRRRVAAIGLSSGWLWGWLACLVVGFGLAVAFWRYLPEVGAAGDASRVTGVD